ncbi:MAG: DUF937 domain-containing protein [Saprospiraceae bacterium]
MANLIDLLQSQLSEGLIDQLSKQIGAPKQQTRTAADSILSSLIGGLAKNAQKPGGADALANALDNDHDGSLLNNLNDLIGGGKSAKINPRSANGAGILKHVLGGKQGGIMDMVSQISGLGQGQTGNLMAMLAPIVMGMLGKQKRSSGLDSGGIANILAGALGTQQKRGGLATTLITNLLDRDGDGSAIDDVAKIGMNIFSKFFRK